MVRHHAQRHAADWPPVLLLPSALRVVAEASGGPARSKAVHSLTSNEAGYQEYIVAQITKTKSEAVSPVNDARIEEEIAYLSKRHRVSPAIVQEIIRRISTSERSAVEREIRKGMARR